MRTIHRSIARFVPLAGMGVMVAGLFGDPALPVASAADVEPFAYQNDWGNQNP
jgi:hypothetical protein